MNIQSMELHQRQHFLLMPVCTSCNLQTQLSSTEGQYQGVSCLLQVS